MAADQTLPTPEACDTCGGSGVYGDDTCPGGCDRGGKVLDVTLPTPAAVGKMRERHVKAPSTQATSPWPLMVCGYCDDLWPCDAARLLALVDHLEVANHMNAAEAHRQLRASVEARARLAAVLAESPRLTLWDRLLLVIMQGPARISKSTRRKER